MNQLRQNSRYIPTNSCSLILNSSGDVMRKQTTLLRSPLNPYILLKSVFPRCIIYTSCVLQCDNHIFRNYIEYIITSEKFHSKILNRRLLPHTISQSYFFIVRDLQSLTDKSQNKSGRISFFLINWFSKKTLPKLFLQLKRILYLLIISIYFNFETLKGQRLGIMGMMGLQKNTQNYLKESLAILKMLSNKD